MSESENMIWPNDEGPVEAYVFTEEDKKVIIAMDAYDKARAALLENEADVEFLWRTIITADRLRHALGMNP